MSPVTLAEWLQHCPLPRLEARLLLQHYTALSHAQIIARDQQPLSENQLAALRQAEARRLAGEPMAYILGQREFYGRHFAVSPDVLIPRPETEHLVEAVLDKLPENGCIWDLGTGSGAIAVTIACERPDAAVWASDISATALTLARHNAHHLQAVIRFGLGNWFDAKPQPPKHSLDVLVSNPPYIDAADHHLQQGDLRFEPAAALTDFADGLSAIRTIIAGAPAYLKPNGWLLLEHGFDQGQNVRALLNRHGFQNTQTGQDLAGLDRVSIGQMSQ